EPRQLDVDGSRSFACLGRGATKLGLAGGELAQRARGVAGARAACVDARPERRLEPQAYLRGPGERMDEPLACADEPRLRDRRWGGRIRPQLFALAFPRPTARLQFEPHRLRGLAREPQLTAARVVAESFWCDGRNRRGKELVFRDDRVALDQLVRA